MKRLVINTANIELLNKFGGQKITEKVWIKPNFKNLSQGLGLSFEPEYYIDESYTKIEIMYKKEVEVTTYNEEGEEIGSEMKVQDFRLPTSFQVSFNQAQINAVKGVVNALATDTFDRFYLAILLMVKNKLDTSFGSEIVTIE